MAQNALSSDPAICDAGNLMTRREIPSSCAVFSLDSDSSNDFSSNPMVNAVILSAPAWAISDPRVAESTPPLRNKAMGTSDMSCCLLDSTRSPRSVSTTCPGDSWDWLVVEEGNRQYWVVLNAPSCQVAIYPGSSGFTFRTADQGAGICPSCKNARTPAWSSFRGIKSEASRAFNSEAKAIFCGSIK